MTTGEPGPVAAAVSHYTSGAVGAGLALVVLPCVALYAGLDGMASLPAVGLPILAIFGIMILFGALALVATLFARLSLSDPTQALALPEGSIRAAIALALIVLFAIIAIMLYQSAAKPYVIGGLDDAQVAELVKHSTNQVIAVVPECAAAVPLADCPAGQERSAVHVLRPPGRESTDLAKQLLILIGTLMTSVTSFYFAARATEPRHEAPPLTREGTAGGGAPASSTAAMDESDVDCCDAEIVNATPDHELPPARGGVA
jgi:TRAP-type C4-dicarboxylate transport system permease small subunit